MPIATWLVIGAGDEGIAAAENAARSGRRASCWSATSMPAARCSSPSREMERQERLAVLATLSDVRVLTRTTAFAIYDHGVVGAVGEPPTIFPSRPQVPCASVNG